MSRKILAIAFIIAAPALFARPSAAQTADHDAIKAVIRTETASFYRRDADAWQSTWLHDARATRTIVTANGYASAVGWEKFGPRVVEAIKKYPRPIPVTNAAENFIIIVGGDLAWVEYDQIQIQTAPGQANSKRLSREHRTLVKSGGHWKIIAQITVDPETFGPDPRAMEGRLNVDGHRLLRAGKVEEAIEIFKVNVRLNPDSWNAHDSLGEAYTAAGKKELAVASYERSLKLNPNNESGKAALAKLRTR
jgi:cytochrome c-type biogenesis protein CcmH/NrfG